MGLFKLWAIKKGETVIRGVQEVGVQGNANQLVLGSDGSAFRTMAAIVEMKPVSNFVTVQIGATLGICGPAGLGIGATDPLELYYAEVEPEGVVKTTGIKCNIIKGVIIPTSLSASQGSHATISFSVIMGGDPATSPIVVSEDVELPAESPATEFFTLGPATINSANIGGLQSTEIDFGVNVEQKMGDGAVYPYQVSILDYNPTIKLGTDNMDMIYQPGFVGTNHNVTAQLNKCDQCKTIAATGHKIFSTHLTSVRAESATASQGGFGSVSIFAQPIYDGTNHPITIS